MKKNYVILAMAGLFLTGLPIQAQEANYDETQVGTYTLPDALTTIDGQQVIKKKQWEKKRRPQILKLFQENEYGILPNAKIKAEYRIAEENENALGGKAIRRQVEITFSGNGSKTLNVLSPDEKAGMDRRERCSSFSTCRRV